MSSCFLCDTSYEMTNNDHHQVWYAEFGANLKYMKYMPIMIGSTGTNTDDQQHKDNNKQNYVSYRVKKIEFRSSVNDYIIEGGEVRIPDYIILFKVPMREPIIDYDFETLNKFILYSEPESVLKYCVCPQRNQIDFPLYYEQKCINKYDLIVNKPFIVGPNDYVGVFYMFYDPVIIESSARVWFDVV